MKKISTIFFAAGLYLIPQAQAQTTTYNDVATIFYNHCTVCHNSGGVAPFSLMNYSEAAAFSTSISTAVSSGKMPPWHADTNYTVYGTNVRTGARFLHENKLSPTESAAILDWVNDGVLEGDPANAPAAPSYGDLTYKLNGTPDAVVQIPTFASNSNSTNTDPYNCFSVPINLTQDRWLRAFEIVPGNLAIVHHVVLSIDTTGTVVSQLDGNCGQQPGEIGIGGWSSGTPPTVFPDDPAFKTGVRIPAGSNMIFQMHYAPGSGGQLDSTKVRLFFYPVGASGIRPMQSDVMLQNWGTLGLFGSDIPANQVKTIAATSATFSPVPHTPQPATAMTLFAVNPHSHNVCRKIKIYASNGADTIPVIRISDWDYNWQGNYYFPTPLKIPAGYTLKTEHVYDNTVNNPHLPGAPVNVSFGQATADEMLFDAFLWLDYQTGDESIDVKGMLDTDPLLQVGINDINTASIETYIYPNPATDNVNIYMTKKSVYTARILNIAGQTILNTDTFTDRVTVDVHNLPDGFYVIEIVDTKSNERITRKIVISN